MTADREHERTPTFRSFHRQLFHASISTILTPLRPAMTKPEVTRCPDGHFRHVIYTLGPYIADYPEQALLTGIVAGWCPKYVHMVSHSQVSHVLQMYSPFIKPRHTIFTSPLTTVD